MPERNPPAQQRAESDFDSLVPDRQVQLEFGVTAMTIHRWTHDVRLGFPAPIKIRTRTFRSRHALETFKQKLIEQALRDRGRCACGD